MSQIRNYIAAAFAAGLLIATPAVAGDTPAEIKQRIGPGDPEAGKEASGMCQGCHGEDGNSAMSTFPKLAGQWSDYIQKQFREFQNGARKDPTMTDMALSVGEFPELFDIAAYFASQNLMTTTVTEDEKEQAQYLDGEKLYNEGNANSGSFRCVMCHGKHGQGEPLNNPLFPIIGGQHKDYLIKQLTDFKNNTRDNDRSGMMMLIAGRLSEQDIVALSSFLGHTLPPPAPPAPLAPPPPVEEWRVLLEDKAVNIEGTSFKSGSSKLNDSADKQLAVVIDFANNIPDAKLELIGYSDSTGSEKNNIKLSENRANSVKKFLVHKGISADRISTKGLGPANPVADNTTAEGREKNRRVEIHSILKEEKKVRVNGAIKEPVE